MGDHFSDRTRTILEVVWITVAVVGFTLNTAQICWILSRSRKSVIDVFIVSLAVSSQAEENNVAANHMIQHAFTVTDGSSTTYLALSELGSYLYYVMLEESKA